MKTNTIKILDAIGTDDMTMAEIISRSNIGYNQAYQAVAFLKRYGYIEVVGFRGAEGSSRGRQVLRRTEKEWAESTTKNPCITVNVPRELKIKFQNMFPNMASEIRKLMEERVRQKEDDAIIIGIVESPFV